MKKERGLFGAMKQRDDVQIARSSVRDDNGRA